MTNIEIVLIVNIQQMTKNMSVEQDHLKAFLLVLLNSVNILNLMIKMIIEKITIEQGHKVPQVQSAHKAHKEFKVHQEPTEHKVLQVSLTQNYVQQGQT